MPWKDGVTPSPATAPSHDFKRNNTRVCVISDCSEYNEDPTSEDEKHDIDVVYEDRFCKLSQDCIILKCYYFPKGLQKRIAISSIQSIEQIKDSSQMVTWGVRDNIWWNYDPSRCCRPSLPRYFAIDCGEVLLKGFTVKNSQEFFELLRKTNIKNLNVNKSTDDATNDLVNDEQARATKVGGERLITEEIQLS